jgi:hypothetical protein
MCTSVAIEDSEQAVAIADVAVMDGSILHALPPA